MSTSTAERYGLTPARPETADERRMRRVSQQAWTNGYETARQAGEVTYSAHRKMPA